MNKHGKVIISKPGYEVYFVMFIFLFVFLSTMIFSYLMPSRAVTVGRYYISIVSLGFILSASGLDIIIGAIRLKDVLNGAVLVFAVTCLVIFCAVSKYVPDLFRNMGSLKHYYEQAIDWVYEKPEAHNENAVMIIVRDNDGLWYYNTHNGRRDPIQILPYASDENDDMYVFWDDPESFEYVFISEQHSQTSLTDEMRRILREEFELTDVEREYNVFEYKRR